MSYTESTFEEIEKVVESKLVINGDDLDGEAIRNQKIFTEINRIYIHKSRKLGELLDQLAKVEHNRFRHYAGKLTSDHYKREPLTEAVLKQDIPSFMNVDPVVTEMRNLVKECERVVKYLEDAKKSLHSRGFDIRNSIDYRKLMLGAG